MEPSSFLRSLKILTEYKLWGFVNVLFPECKYIKRKCIKSVFLNTSSRKEGKGN